MKKSISILFFFITVSIVNAQWDENPLKFSLGEYNFKSYYDTTDFNSKLTVVKKGETLYSNEFSGRIFSIKADELGEDGKIDILIGVYSGGAHCCFSVYTGHTEERDFIITDSLMLGNSDFEIKDLNDDNQREIFAYDDRFAYVFTSYAGSRFSPVVYTVSNYKFENITGKFPAVINSNIDDLKSQMNELIGKGYNCPAVGEDAFSSDAGMAKAILAPLVQDYMNLGEVSKGYDYVNSVYKCSDKQSFIDTLKIVYKLK